MRLTYKEFELVIDALQQPNADHQLLLNLEALKNLNVSAVSQAISNREDIDAAVTRYHFFFELLGIIGDKCRFIYNSGEVHNPAVDNSLMLRYSYIGRLYMSLPLRALATGLNNRGLTASGSQSQRILDLKLVFPKKLERHTFNDLFKISLKFWKEIDQELSKSIISIMTSDYSYLGDIQCNLIPHPNYTITSNSKESDLQRWYNSLLIEGWNKVLCAGNLLPELKAVRITDISHEFPKKLQRTILNGNHFDLYPNESHASVLADILSSDQMSINETSDLHSNTKPNFLITEDFGINSDPCHIALGLIQLQVDNISNYFDEDGALLNSSYQARLRFAQLLREAFRHLIDLGTTRFFIIADTSSQVLIECCFETYDDITAALERLDACEYDSDVAKFNARSEISSSVDIRDTDEKPVTKHDISFLPLLKFTLFKNGVCELITKPNNEESTSSRRLNITFQAFITGYIMSQQRRIKHLRNLEREQNIPNDIRCDELVEVSELLISRTVHRILYKGEVSAQTYLETGSATRITAQSATSGASGQQNPVSSGNYTENNLNPSLGPSICNISKFHEPSQNNSKPFCFKPLQAGPGFYSVVLLFQTRDIITYFPELLAACPQITNFEKVVLKTYDKSELLDRYLTDKYANVRMDESFDMFFNRYEKMADQEVRAMSRIMEHNLSAGDEALKVNIPQLLCYGNIRFDTYVSRWGPSDLHGPYLLTEYLEQDGLSDAGSQTGDFKISDSQYDEGVTQLQTLRKLGILHNDLRNRRNLLIKNNHLYFIDFGLSSFLDDDGSERVQYQFDQELDAFFMGCFEHIDPEFDFY